MKALLILLLAASTAWAEEPSIGVRTTFGLGYWKGVFTQTAPGQSVSLITPGSIAVEGSVGLRVGFAFVEYAPSAFVPAITNGSAGVADASYYSVSSVNAGVSFPDFPIEGYLGLESGNYTFTSGSIGGFNALAGRAGMDILLKAQNGAGIGLRAEYRRMLISGDRAGAYPSGVSAGADIFFVGVTAGFFGPKSTVTAASEQSESK